ncbi:hypothetical protein G3M48_008288 [Beauveria asiatica]|uniref:Uncharacterized protein n=1 Tax=Beauveria asiatica TaxID=1069075 RepID=A0AAW0RKQ6_9HYPO
MLVNSIRYSLVALPENKALLDDHNGAVCRNGVEAFPKSLFPQTVFISCRWSLVSMAWVHDWLFFGVAWCHFVAAATDAPAIRGCDGESNFGPPFNATGTVSFVTESFTHNIGKAWYLSVGLKDRRDKNVA